MLNRASGNACSASASVGIGSPPIRILVSSRAVSTPTGAGLPVSRNNVLSWKHIGTQSRLVTTSVSR